MKQARLAIAGLGNVGKRLLELIEQKRGWLQKNYDLDLVVVGVCDSTGGAVNPAGLSIRKIIDVKRAKKGAVAYPEFGQAPMSPIDLAQQVDADIFVELTLTNLKDGQPGLDAIQSAFAKKEHVVTANKGPLVLAYPELAARAREQGVRFLHSATVTGGLPTLNLGARDLGAATIEKFEGVVNGTTNYILSRMSEGQAYEHALKHAQEIGMAEADPTLDVDGWDAASKLVIVANAVLRRPTTLQDVQVEGIRGVTQDELRLATQHNKVVKLIALAERSGDDYLLSVTPTTLDKSHPLSGVGAGMMGVMYHTDINGVIFAAIEEENPYPTAAGVLRDIVHAAI